MSYAGMEPPFTCLTHIAKAGLRASPTWYGSTRGQALIDGDSAEFQPNPFGQFFHFDGKLGEPQSRHFDNGAATVRFQDGA